MFRHQGVFIRVIEERDLNALRALRNDPSTWINLTDTRLLTESMQQQWFQRLGSTQSQMYFAAGDETHDLVGVVRCDEIDRQNRSMRIGCDVVPALRGQRYGSRIYDLMLKYCFDFMNMHRVWLLVIDSNDVAIRLYRSKGFQEEGRYRDALFRDGRYRDYIVMSVLEPEYRRS